MALVGKTRFVVENISDTTIILSDLRSTEIGPHQVLDLEKVVRRIDIERSLDLIKAFKAGLLKLISNKKPKIKVQERLSQEELQQMMEEAIAKAMARASKKGEVLDVTKLHESIKQQISHSIDKQLGNKLDTQVDDKISDKLDTLMQAIQSLKQVQVPVGEKSEKIEGPVVNIAELAEIMQKEINSISKEMAEEKPQERKIKKIKLATRASDLAKELD